MKESFPQKNNSDDKKKMAGEKGFLKRHLRKIAIVAGLGLAGTGAVELKKNMNDFYTESQEHKKQTHAMVYEKNHKDYSNQVLIINKIPMVIPHPDEWTVTLKIGNVESIIPVSKEVYEKYNTGDKIYVDYDDRNSKVLKLATPTSGDESKN